jgi:hypothetical protein
VDEERDPRHQWPRGGHDQRGQSESHRGPPDRWRSGAPAANAVPRPEGAPSRFGASARRQRQLRFPTWITERQYPCVGIAPTSPPGRWRKQ